MMAQLPDECKRQIWQLFEAQELCRVACVARGISKGANADAVWKKRTRALITKRLTEAHRTPVECGLARQNAQRDLLSAKSSSSSSHTILARMSQLTSSDGADDDDAAMVAEDSTYWRHWYRDFHVVSFAFSLQMSCTADRCI